MAKRKHKQSIYAGWPRDMWPYVLTVFALEALRKPEGERTQQEKNAIKKMNARDALERD